MFQEFCPPTPPNRVGKIKYCKRSKSGEHCWDWRVVKKFGSYFIIEWYCVNCGKKEDRLWWHWGGMYCERLLGVDVVLYCLLSKI